MSPLIGLTRIQVCPNYATIPMLLMSHVSGLPMSCLIRSVHAATVPMLLICLRSAQTALLSMSQVFPCMLPLSPCSCLRSSLACCQYQDLNHLLGVDWHFRGINENGDFCYVILDTLELYLYRRRPIKEFMPGTPLRITYKSILVAMS